MIEAASAGGLEVFLLQLEPIAQPPQAVAAPRR